MTTVDILRTDRESGAKGQLVLFPTLDEVYDYLAEEMVKEFAKAARGKKMV